MHPTVIILLVAHNKSHLYATTVIDGLVSEAVFRHPMSQTGELQLSSVHDTVATSIFDAVCSEVHESTKRGE